LKENFSIFQEKEEKEKDGEGGGKEKDRDSERSRKLMVCQHADIRERLDTFSFYERR